MSKHRRAARKDTNEKEIVDNLLMFPGVSVDVNRDDIFVGYLGVNYWYEIKNPEVISTKTGKVQPSKIKDSQVKLLKNWKGHYKIVSTLEEILIDIGIYGE
jgi:hypothetical protein